MLTARTAQMPDSALPQTLYTADSMHAVKADTLRPAGKI